MCGVIVMVISGCVLVGVLLLVCLRAFTLLVSVDVIRLALLGWGCLRDGFIILDLCCVKYGVN